VFNLAGHREIPGALVKGPAAADGATAWVCQGTQCLPPIHALPDLLRILSRET
jgi:uncharacterized protein YyaL (SSP411 family)